jgi:heme-degrading monooxygenase HmoA
MVYEVVIQKVDPDNRDDHVRVWKEAWKEANFGGSHDVRFLKCIEDPSRVIVLIQWDSVEAHAAHRGTPSHNRFREKSAVHQTGPTDIAHFTFEDL